MEEKQMNKYYVLILGLALGFFIGIFVVLILQERSNSVTSKNVVESEIVSEESQKEPEETSIGRTEVHEKIAEDLSGIVSNSHYYSQMLEFQQKGKQVDEKSFKVFQVLSNGKALVYGKDEYGYYDGIVYLLIDCADSDMFDDQIIKVPKNKVVKRYGTYQYITRNGREKTVPQIMILDAN